MPHHRVLATLVGLFAVTLAYGAEEPKPKTITVKFEHKLFDFQSEYTICRTENGHLFVLQHVSETGLNILQLFDGKTLHTGLMRDGRTHTLNYFDYTRLRAKLGAVSKEEFLFRTLFSTLDGVVHPKYRASYFGELFKDAVSEYVAAGTEKVKDEELDKYVCRSKNFERTSLFSPKDGFLIQGVSKMGDRQTSTKRVSTSDKEPKELEAFRKFIRENEKAKEDITEKLGKVDDDN